MATHLGKIEEAGLREGWPSEDGDFTPWLAANIAELAGALGIPLKLIERESWTGGRRVDILATSAGHPVVIENQLECTDEDHFRRLLVYAAGKDARTVIWIAASMDDEHWRVMHWLNRRNSAARFYGVVIKLLKIGDSRPAPYFKVVVAPDDMRERNTGGRAAFNTGLDRAENRIFSVWLEQKLRKKHDFHITDACGDRPWVRLDEPHGGVRYALNLQHPKMNVALQLHTDNKERTLDWCHQSYDRLKESKEVIESAVVLPSEGETAEWRREWQGNRGSDIEIHRNFDVRGNYESWGEYQDWVISKFFKLREVFEPRLSALLARE